MCGWVAFGKKKKKTIYLKFFSTILYLSIALLNAIKLEEKKLCKFFSKYKDYFYSRKLGVLSAQGIGIQSK